MHEQAEWAPPRAPHPQIMFDSDVFRNAKPASVLLGAACAGLTAHAAYAVLNEQAGAGEPVSNWVFYGLALLVLAAGRRARRSRARRAHRMDGRIRRIRRLVHGLASYYASGAAPSRTSMRFPLADALLLPFAGAAAATVAILVRSRVQPFQPTLLLDGLIVALAAGAVAAVPWTHLPRTASRRVQPRRHAEGAYPLGAVMLLAFVAVGAWRSPAGGSTARGRPPSVGLALAAWPRLAFLFQTVSGDYYAGHARRLAVAGRRPGARVRGVAAARAAACPCASTGRAAWASRRWAASGAAGPAGRAVRCPSASPRSCWPPRTLVALIIRAAVAFKESRAAVRRRAHRGADRRAHGARQPPQADDRPAARAAGRQRAVARACWCCSTSTASSATTTPSATPPATRCWRGSAATSGARSGPTAPATGSAATSSACW